MSIRNFVLSAFLAVAAASSVLAAEVMVVKVPFAFRVGATQLPGGEYSIKSVGLQGLVTLQNTIETKKVASTFSTPGAVSVTPNTALVFACPKGDCTLTEIRPQGATTLELTASMRSVQAQQNRAAE